MTSIRVWALRAAVCVVVAWVTGTSALGATFTVTDLSDSGLNSLRQAIVAANTLPGADTINVNATTPGTITLLTPLPAITDTVAIVNVNTGSGRIELNGIQTQGDPASIGFDFQAPNCELWGFAVNRFGVAGVRIGPNAAGTTNGNGTVIHQNYIGTDVTGQNALCPDAAHPCGNVNRGVWVDGASNVQVGVGGSGGHPNTISGNFGRGVAVNNKVAGGTLFQGSAIIKNNHIGGIDSAINPNTALGNSQDGILLAGVSNCQIGGMASNDTNFIVANGGNGINIVADKTMGAGNVTVDSPASFNVIQGNYIGYSGGSNTAIGNTGSGIVIEGSNNTIGGTTPAARNIITGNHVNGISIYGSLASGNTVQGNYIGAGSTGTAFGNDVAGIQLAQNAADNLIGGPGVTPGSCNGACNVIANNGRATAQSAKAGIYVDPTAAIGNRIRANSIYSNGTGTAEGIDLGDPGKNADDAQDPDTGPNDLQNRPVVTTANTSKFISGTLNSVPATMFVIDLFLNSAGDSQARTYLGSVNTTTNASGDASFNFTSSVALPLGQSVTATATRRSGSVNAPVDIETSEISNPAPIISTPTAANASISGRAMTSSGYPIARVLVTLTDTNGEARVALTNSFGYFFFTDVPSGNAYVVTASRKGYSFAPRLLLVTDNVEDYTLTPEP
jgi:hypothetical protein